MWTRGGKRLFDAVAAMLLLVLLVPVLSLVGLVAFLGMGPPVIFRQRRPGLRGALFTIVKFRTMRKAESDGGRALPDERRLTKVGRFLRRTSLDELPTLWNVVRGDMSLVGPRPLLPQYLDRYSPRQARRHEVRPGITGWAQVSGRNATTWERRFEFDEWYVDHCGFWLDMRILTMTLWNVLTGTGISAPGHATMPEFEGTDRGDH